MSINYEDYCTDKEEVAEYLEGVRESGTVNMIGAGPYLEQRFGMSRRDANDAVLTWIKEYK